MKPYQPIDCGYYDLIELTIMRRRPVQLAYLDPQGTPQQRHLRLLDTLVREGVEYVILPDNERLRMDHIISIDGVPRPGTADSSCTHLPG